MDAKKPSRELSISEILSSAFNLYRSKFAQFFFLYLIYGIIYGTSYYAITSTFPIPETPTIPTSPSPTFYYEELFPWFVEIISTIIITIILLGLIAVIVSAIINGIAVKNTSDQIEKGSINLGQSLSFVVSKLPTLLLAMFIIGILVIVGAIFFVIPGIIVALMFSVTIPTIIVEQKGAFESLGRSKKLASKRWLKIFLLVIIWAIIFIVATLIGNALAIPFSNIHPIVNPLIQNIVVAFVLPIYAIAITYLYYSMAAREYPQMVENI